MYYLEKVKIKVSNMLYDVYGRIDTTEDTVMTELLNVHKVHDAVVNVLKDNRK